MRLLLCACALVGGLGAGSSLARGQDDAQARRSALQARIAAGGASPRDLCRLGHVELELGALDDAATHLARGIDRAIREIRSDRIRNRLVGACRYDHGRVEELRGNHDEAMTLFANSLAVRPNPVVSRAHTRAAAMRYASQGDCGASSIARQLGPPPAGDRAEYDARRARRLATVLDILLRARLVDPHADIARCAEQLRALRGAEPCRRLDAMPTDVDVRHRDEAGGVTFYFRGPPSAEFARMSFAWEHEGQVLECDLRHHGWTVPHHDVSAGVERRAFAGRPVLRVAWRTGFTPNTRCTGEREMIWDRADNLAWVTLDGRMLMRAREQIGGTLRCGERPPPEESFRTLRFEGDGDTMRTSAHTRALDGRPVRLAPDGFRARREP